MMKKGKKTNLEEVEILENEEKHDCNDDCCCGEECHCNEEKTCKCGDECHCNEDKIKDLEEKLAYSKAELINYRKRKDEEVSNMLKYANQDLILELLPIVDNFERAMTLANSENTELKKFLDGFNMLYVSIIDIFKKFGVEEINEKDIPFDPTIHEALLVDENKDKENDTILEVLLKGYKLKGRIIRPAQVKVNKIN